MNGLNETERNNNINIMNSDAQMGMQQAYPQMAGQQNIAPAAWTNGPVTGNSQAVTNKRGEKLEKMLDNFHIFGIGCILYGILFMICLYKGFHGISLPILSAVTMGYLIWGFRFLDIKVKKSTWFYFASWETLSISNCLTGSSVIIFFNICGMILLFFSFLLTHFCNTSKWGFEKYFGEIFAAPFVTLCYLGYPFKAIAKYFGKREKGKSATAKYIWLGIIISIPLLLVIVGLLVSADAVFRNLFLRIFSDILFPEYPLRMVFLFVIGSIGFYSLLAYFADGQIKDTIEEKNKWEPVVGITFLFIITVVYLIFSVIQISYLFLGSFALPDGYTYAAYAREGFFQLLFICMINLVIILICISRFRENIALKIILTIFSCCTFIMIASSAMRMILYIDSYQLTFLRLLVLWALVVISMLLLGCIVTIYKNQFPLFQYATIVVTIMYIIFSLGKPDYLIAKYNLTYNMENIDLYYLSNLSTDAIPAMEEAGVLQSIDERLERLKRKDSEKGNQDMEYTRNLRRKINSYDEMGILDFNYSYYNGGKILKNYENIR